MKGRTVRTTVTAPQPEPPAPKPGRLGASELVAAVAIVLCALLAWLARSTLNPDGVSYLDLAGRVAAGDWSSFVQGYWSPLYPLLIALIGRVAGSEPIAQVATAHAINGVVAMAAVVLLWWWGRRRAKPQFAVAAIATFLLISAGLPRIEAVTPDVLLLALLAGLGYELLVHRGARWLVTGLLLGATFLVKTSAWPWLLLALPLRLWGARDRPARIQVALSSAVALLVMLTWVAPMSRKAGQVTLGSAGRLNYCWYLEACDSRTPDTHLGEHLAYHQFAIDSTQAITWADFGNDPRWTYAPWSDPTAWDAGVLSKASETPTVTALLAYWGRQARNSFGLWLLPVLLGIVVPWYLLQRRPGMWRTLLDGDRAVLVTALLGLAGVAQFVLVHSEPRLIAPFGLLFALAALDWLLTTDPTLPRFTPAVRLAVSALGLLGAAGFAVPRLQDGFASSARIEQVVGAMATNEARLNSAGLSQARIVILGPAIPVEASAYLSGARIVAQVPPNGLEIIRHLPPEQQRRVMTELFGGKADIAWLTTADAGVTLVVIPKK
jgi:hypothetical protein